MKRIWIILAGVALLLATAATGGGAQARSISAVPGTQAVAQTATLATSAFGINSAGDITGTYVTHTGSYGYLLHDGTYTKFDVPAAANFTEAKAINAADDIVGDYADSRGNFHGFQRHENNTYTTLDVPGAVNGTFPYGITNAGDIAGFYTDRRGHTHGFLLHNGTYTTLDDPKATGDTFIFGINNAGDIVGAAIFSGERQGFLLHNGIYTTLEAPGAEDTYGNGINPVGEIVGGDKADVSGPTHGYLLHDGIYTAFNVPGRLAEPIRITSTRRATSWGPTSTARTTTMASCYTMASTPRSTFPKGEPYESCSTRRRNMNNL